MIEIALLAAVFALACGLVTVLVQRDRALEELHYTKVHNERLIHWWGKSPGVPPPPQRPFRKG